MPDEAPVTNTGYRVLEGVPGVAGEEAFNAYCSVKITDLAKLRLRSSIDLNPAS